MKRRVVVAMDDHRQHGALALLCVSLVLALIVSSAASLAATIVQCENGIRATIHSAEEIEADWTYRDGQLTVVRHPAIGSLELLSGTNDVRLERPVTAFHAYSADVVARSLRDVHGFTTSLDVEVFLLPAPPANTQSSFARHNVIFLAPGLLPVPETTQAYTTVHELGHVLTWAFFDEYPTRWASYLAARHLDDDAFGHDVPHADRAREILAEDIRYLFGGVQATASGSIENHALALPDQVMGLETLLVGFFDEVAAPVQAEINTWAYPNPCNPLTTIGMAIPVGTRVSADNSAILRIFDIRGRLVRTLGGGHLANNRVAVQWDSSDETGAAVASGKYLFVLSIGPVHARGSITVAR